MINPRLPNVKNIERSSVKLTHAKRKLKIQKFAQYNHLNVNYTKLKEHCNYLIFPNNLKLQSLRLINFNWFRI